jgi:hypothetical protein
MASQILNVPLGECWEISLRVTQVGPTKTRLIGTKIAKVIDNELEVVRGQISDTNFIELCEGDYTVTWDDDSCLTVEVLIKTTLTEVPDLDYEYICNETTDQWELHYFVTTRGQPNPVPTIVPTNIPCSEGNFAQVSYCNASTGTVWIRATSYNNGVQTTLSNVDTGVACSGGSDGGGGSSYTQADLKEADFENNTSLRVHDQALINQATSLNTALNTLNTSQQVRTTEFFSQESSVSQNLVASNWQSVSIEFIEGTGTINGITYPKIANGYVLSGLEWQANMNGSNSNVIAIVANAGSSYVISGVRYV